MKCVICDRKMHYEADIKTCYCCDDSYEVITFTCRHCEVELEVQSMTPMRHSNQQRRRGIGRTN